MRLNQKKVSVIVPCYNSENSIFNCLNSLFTQTYKNIEIIVVNDESTDNSLQILNNLKKDHNNLIVFTQKNSGPGFARNRGIEMASGEYVMFVDSDDYVDLCMIEKLVNIIEKNNVDVVRCSYKMVYPSGKLKSFNFNRSSQKISNKILLEEWLLESVLWNTVWGQLIRKDKLVDLWFDTDKRIGEDLLFNVKLYSKIKNIYFFNEELYYYTYSPNGITKQMSVLNIKRNLTDVIDNYFILYDFFQLLKNKQKIVNRCVRAVISYELQLLYLSRKEFDFIKLVNQKKKIRDFFVKYNGKKYFIIIKAIIREKYFIYYLYFICFYFPLKKLKQSIKV